MNGKEAECIAEEVIERGRKMEDMKTQARIEKR